MTACAKCHKERDGHECARVDCPVRKPGTSFWGPDNSPPWAGKHDGLGWDRFYKGQRNPPNWKAER